MAITSASAQAWVIPNHVRIIDIDTTVNNQIKWNFPQDAVNYTGRSIQYIHSSSEYSSLDQKSEILLATYSGDIKVVIDIEWRSQEWQLRWNFHIYNEVRQFWKVIWLVKRTSIQIDTVDTIVSTVSIWIEVLFTNQITFQNCLTSL